MSAKDSDKPWHHVVVIGVTSVGILALGYLLWTPRKGPYETPIEGALKWRREQRGRVGYALTCSTTFEPSGTSTCLASPPPSPTGSGKETTLVCTKAGCKSLGGP